MQGLIETQIQLKKLIIVTIIILTTYYVLGPILHVFLSPCYLQEHSETGSLTLSFSLRKM
jgi:hypothetical protein